MNIEDIELGDTVYINHHVVEPKVVDPDSASESTVNFAERSAQVRLTRSTKTKGDNSLTLVYVLGGVLLIIATAKS